MGDDGKESPFDPQTALLLRAVAHDVNNLLSSVLGHAELLEAQAEGGSTLDRRSRAIRRAALKGVEVTRKLSASGRDLNLHLEPVEVHSLLEEECQRFRGTLREGVELQAELPKSLVLRADGRALQQIASALLSNARTWCSSPGWIRFSLRETENGAELIVTDSGPGFSDSLSDEELVAPFVGSGREGSGLGLWTVDRLVRAHGGTVSLRRGPQAQVVCAFPGA